MTPSTVDEHAAHIGALLASALSVGSERMPLLAALGRVAAGDVLSPVDLPLFTNSQMDGFAVAAADIATVPVTLPIVGVIAAAAGEPPPLRRGTAVRIMTGAPIPIGADAVVPVEQTTSDGTAVTVMVSRQCGEYVRDRGSDLRAGEVIVQQSQLLSSRHLAAVAASGIAELEVRSRLRIAIITTGAELVGDGESMPGQVYDSNSIALVAAARLAGAEVTLARRVTDEPAVLLAAMNEAASVADVIITSGGISMGDFEVVRELLEPRGAVIATVRMQPGGPQATALFEGTPVICFPGNPVSTQLSFEIFVAPLLRRLAGLAPAAITARTLSGDLRSVAGKRQYLRGRALDNGMAEVVAGPGSHLVAALAASDILIIVPEQTTVMTAGEEVETLAL